MRYPPDSTQNSGNMPERGSGDGGGASGSLFGMNILCFGLMGAGTALVLIGLYYERLGATENFVYRGLDG